MNINGIAIINIYRQSSNDTILEYILDFDPLTKCLLGGDFNVYHDHFEPRVTTFGRGGDLVQWSSVTEMDFIGEVGTPTHEAGHVLDLSFSNIPFAYTTVEKVLATGSDHETLLTVILGYGDMPVRVPQYKVTDSDLEQFVSLIEVGFKALEDPRSMHTHNKLDSFASGMEEIFKIAIEKGGTLSKAKSRAAPWWTLECKQAHFAYILARQNQSLYETEKKTFLTTVRRAKKEYWRRIIDKATDDKSLYKVVSWHKKAPKLKAPPLKSGDQVVEDTLEKAELLRKEILGRFSAKDDLPDFELEDFHPEEYAGLQSLPWNCNLSIEEVERCTISVPSTSPSTDKITVRLLKAC